jgi:hypothetical protein
MYTCILYIETGINTRYSIFTIQIIAIFIFLLLVTKYLACALTVHRIYIYTAGGLHYYTIHMHLGNTVKKGKITLLRPEQ